MISTLRLLGREVDLNIYGPKGLKQIISLQLKLSKSWTNFNLVFHELNDKYSKCIFEDSRVEVHTIPLDHRVYTNGFLFKEKPFDRKLIIENAKAKNIDVAFYRKLKQGVDVYNKDGILVKNTDVTANGRTPRRYAFCSDTAYSEAIIPIIKGVDTLYHESTFLEDQAFLCKKTKHSTAKQAASIAKQAGVGRLILGHYSSRHKDLEPFKVEAMTIFKKVELAKDGKIFHI